MRITTIIAFRLPDEYLDAGRFEEQNDMSLWHKTMTTEWVLYTSCFGTK